MSKSKHTELPWSIGIELDGCHAGTSTWIVSDNKLVAKTTNQIRPNYTGSIAEAEANARFILCAVNCHNELVEAAKNVCFAEYDYSRVLAENKLLAVLAKVKELENE